MKIRYGETLTQLEIGAFIEVPKISMLEYTIALMPLLKSNKTLVANKTLREIHLYNTKTSSLLMLTENKITFYIIKTAIDIEIVNNLLSLLDLRYVITYMAGTPYLVNYRNGS